ncbi:MAG: transglutaminase-like cysteine peptidase, partial [Desulfoarculaceae bacterium]|nr:transglutaminase-like cysteine peptidase [Desulfoarculaceae bacterium]
MTAPREKMLPPTTKPTFSSFDLRNTVPMPTAAAKKQHLGLALFRAVFILIGLFLLSSLVAAAPDFDLMSQLAGQRFGMEGRRAISEWQQLLTEAGELPEEEQLQAVNEFVNNAVRFGNDAAIWGQPDYWATPLETLSRGQGDCEDFAIAKYATLKLLGVPGEKLRLTYVKARLGGMYSQITQAHMVLSYYSTPTDLPLILDNLITDIMPASQRRDLHPIFSFSIEDLWIGSSALPAANASARLSRWRDVLNRMRGEGLNVLFEPEKIEVDPEVLKTKIQATQNVQEMQKTQEAQEVREKEMEEGERREVETEKTQVPQ